MNNLNYQPHQVKIPFGEFPRVKCKCGGEMLQLTKRFRVWRIPRLLQHKFANQAHIFAELYACTKCGEISEDTINMPRFPSGISTEDLAIVLCSEPKCQNREFKAIQIAYIVPTTYSRMIGANRLNIEYMLCSTCGALAKEINRYPIPEGVAWKPKK